MKRWPFVVPTFLFLNSPFSVDLAINPYKEKMVCL